MGVAVYFLVIAPDYFSFRRGLGWDWGEVHAVFSEIIKNISSVSSIFIHRHRRFLTMCISRCHLLLLLLQGKVS